MDSLNEVLADDRVKRTLERTVLYRLAANISVSLVVSRWVVRIEVVSLSSFLKFCVLSLGADGLSIIASLATYILLTPPATKNTAYCLGKP